MAKLKAVTYKSSDGGPVSARWASGPAIKVGRRVVWVRPEKAKDKK